MKIVIRMKWKEKDETKEEEKRKNLLLHDFIYGGKHNHDSITFRSDTMTELVARMASESL